MKRFLLGFIFIISGIFFGQQTYISFPDNVDAPLSAKEKQLFAEVYGQDLAYLKDRAPLFKTLRDLVRNRVQVYQLPYEKAFYSPKYRDAVDLTTVRINNPLNLNITRDMIYNKSSFNILKYQISIVPKEKKIYKLGDYYIVISPELTKER